jgi:hypothetical protein
VPSEYLTIDELQMSCSDGRQLQGDLATNGANANHGHLDRRQKFSSQGSQAKRHWAQKYSLHLGHVV